MFFRELPSFFDDPTDIGSLISCSSTFSKFSLSIWKFSVHVLLKPCLENFEHYLASVWDECNSVVVSTFFGIALLWDWNENLELDWNDLFQCCGHCWVFQICWHIEWSTLAAASFKIWNSLAGILSPTLALFLVMLPKTYLTSHSRMSAIGVWSHHCGYLGH